MKIPGVDHPITVEPAPERVVVRAGDRVVAESTEALVLREADLPPAYYIPLHDVDATLISRSDTHTHCPYKGQASYYDLITPDGAVHDAIWTYEQPYPAVAAIAGHVAFYPDRVDITTA